MRINGAAQFACAISAFASPTAAAAQTAYVHMSGAGREFAVTRIAPNIVQFTVLRDSYVRQINSTAIITDQDVILIDTLTRPSSAALLLEKLRAITPKPVRIVINTHAHPDHWSGTEVFARAFPGLEVIASNQTARFMHLISPVWAGRAAKQVADKEAEVAKEKAASKLADGLAPRPEQLGQDERDLVDLKSLADEFARLTRFFPTVTYNDHLHLTHGGVDLDLDAVTGDQAGNTQVYLPHERVLITGDLVSFPMPFFNARPSKQLASLKAIDATDFAVLIPGHGPAMRDHRFVRLEIALIEAAMAGVEREIRGGNSEIDAIQSRVTIPELRAQFTGGDADLEQRYTTRVRDLVKFVVQEMADTG
jgi:cyclase